MQAKARLLLEQQLLAVTTEQLHVGFFILNAPLGAVAVFNRKMRELWGGVPDSVLDELRAGNFQHMPR
jgi:hypothetical protein